MPGEAGGDARPTDARPTDDRPTDDRPGGPGCPEKGVRSDRGFGRWGVA
jgi:hypothetical protein